MKQKTLIPLIVFLLGICLVGIILYKVDSHETAQNHTTALLNATTYGERIKNEITEGIDWHSSRVAGNKHRDHGNAQSTGGQHYSRFNKLCIISISRYPLQFHNNKQNHYY